MSVTGSVTGKKPSAINKKNKLKVRVPKKFDKTKKNLNVFLLQCNLYMYIKKKILFFKTKYCLFVYT